MTLMSAVMGWGPRPEARLEACHGPAIGVISSASFQFMRDVHRNDDDAGRGTMQVPSAMSSDTA